MTEAQLVGPRISPLRNLSVKREAAGFGRVGMVWYLASKEEGPQGCPFLPGVSAGMIIVYLGGCGMEEVRGGWWMWGWA